MKQAQNESLILNESEKFKRFSERIISVSKEAIDQREKEYKKARKKNRGKL